MIRLLMALEILMIAANLSLVAFSAYGVPGFIHPLAHALGILSIGVGGCVIALGLAITLRAYKQYGTLDVRELRRLRW